MPYDQALAERVRGLLGAESGLTEKKMFGGLAFLVTGNMAVAASGNGGLMVRVDPEAGARLVDSTTAEAVVMRGRAMSGWLAITSADVAEEHDLRDWVRRGVDFARSLPAKT
ncbi:MAG: TfoX/Sxy family protein [Candidatus Dormiibacterota bacterium]